MHAWSMYYIMYVKLQAAFFFLLLINLCKMSENSAHVTFLMYTLDLVSYDLKEKKATILVFK